MAVLPGSGGRAADALVLAAFSLAALLAALSAALDLADAVQDRVSGREAVTLGSFCRREPAAELRGLANAALPASSSASLSFSNALTGRNTSPRTSSTAGYPVPDSRCGIESIVLMLAVTSSPVRPSPRVAARNSAPSRYTRSIASPSIFSSHR